MATSDSAHPVTWLLLAVGTVCLVGGIVVRFQDGPGQLFFAGGLLLSGLANLHERYRVRLAAPEEKALPYLIMGVLLCLAGVVSLLRAGGG